MGARKDAWEGAMCVALVLCLALLSVELSFKFRFEKLDHMFRSDLDTLRGHALIPEFQNRIIAPLMLYAARQLAPVGVDNGLIWHGTRTLSAFLSYLVVFGAVFRLTGGRLRALIAVGLVTYAYLWTPMTSPYELSNDFYDVMFISLFVACTLAERPVALIVLAIIASANRESSAFAGVIWLGVAVMRYGWHPRHWRKFLPGFIATLSAAATVIGLRHSLSFDFQPVQFFGILWTLQHWQRLFSPFGAIPMLLATILGFTMMLRLLPRPWTVEQRGLLLAAGICAAITSIFGVTFELRVWLPVWTILSFLAVTGADGLGDRDWLATLGYRKP